MKKKRNGIITIMWVILIITIIGSIIISRSIGIEPPENCKEQVEKGEKENCLLTGTWYFISLGIILIILTEIIFILMLHYNSPFEDEIKPRERPLRTKTYALLFSCVLTAIIFGISNTSLEVIYIVFKIIGIIAIIMFVLVGWFKLNEKMANKIYKR